MTAYGRAAGTRAKMRSRARKEASVQEVRGYYKQFAEAKHLEYRSWVDNEVFDLIDLKKVTPRSHVTGRWVLAIKIDKEGHFLKTRARWVLRGFQDKEKEDLQTDPLRPKDLDFGWIAKWQPKRCGIFVTLISKQHSYKDNVTMWTVRLCVNYHQKQVIHHTLLLDWRNLHMAWMMHTRRWWNILDKALCSCGVVPTRADRCGYVLYSIQPRERTQTTSQINRVGGRKQMLHMIVSWIWLSLVLRHRWKRVNMTVKMLRKWRLLSHKTCIQFPGPVTSTLVKILCVYLNSRHHFSHSVSPSFLSKRCTHVVIEFDWCLQSEQMDVDCQPASWRLVLRRSGVLSTQHWFFLMRRIWNQRNSKGHPKMQVLI